MKASYILCIILSLSIHLNGQNIYDSSMHMDKGTRSSHDSNRIKRKDEFESPSSLAKWIYRKSHPSPTDSAHVKKANRLHHRYGVWYTPVAHSNIINGVAVGIFTSTFKKNKTLKINGVNIEADPFPIVAVPFVVLGVLIRVPVALLTEKRTVKSHPDTMNRHLNKPENDSINQKQWANIRVKINGLNLSTSIIEHETQVNGVAINVLFAMENKMNGVEITPLFNWHKCFNGIIVGGIANTVNNGHGVQIGIYNECKKGKVLQIGLFNKIWTRSTPFINFSFRHPKKNSEKTK